LVERAGMEERAIPRVVLAGIRKLSTELNHLPRSGRALRRLRRSEAMAVVGIIAKLIRRQRRLETLLAGEMVWRRQIMTRLRATDTVLPLINNGHLDRLEVLLARRRGKGGVNKNAQLLGILRAATHPYSLEHMSKLGRAGAARRWARAKEKANGDHERDAGFACGTGGVDREGCDAGVGATGRAAGRRCRAEKDGALPSVPG
jgi:hypothetical protein